MHDDAGVRHRIPVIVDNRDGADSFATMLDVLGHETRRAYDAARRSAVGEAFAPMSPCSNSAKARVSGCEASQRMRTERWRRSLTIIAPGWREEHDRRRSAAGGVDAHRAKPVDPGELAALLARVPPDGVRREGQRFAQCAPKRSTNTNCQPPT